ncbi:MAG: hypothetical protein WA064_01055 [Candidatus Moraniibacteriota bacterium]
MKKVFFLFISFLFLFSILGVSADNSASKLTGWLWGGSDDGLGNATGVGWASTSSAGYGIAIPIGDGTLSGYGWSENIGWISFNASDLAGCPSGSCLAVKSGNSITGWARILSIKDALAGGNSGGWEGWISLAGAGYGLQINPDGSFTKSATTSYAWSNELGWIDFSRVSFKTLLAGASASPNIVADTTPTNIIVAVTGTTTGDVLYELDCDNSGDFTDGTVTTADSTHTFSDICSYGASGTAAVRVTREGITVTAATPIIFGCFTYDCSDDYTTCNRSILNSGCSQEETCRATCRNPAWKEVAP